MIVYCAFKMIYYNVTYQIHVRSINLICIFAYVQCPQNQNLRFNEMVVVWFVYYCILPIWPRYSVNKNVEAKCDYHNFFSLLTSPYKNWRYWHKSEDLTTYFILNSRNSWNSFAEGLTRIKSRQLYMVDQKKGNGILPTICGSNNWYQCMR